MNDISDTSGSVKYNEIVIYTGWHLSEAVLYKILSESDLE